MDGMLNTTRFGASIDRVFPIGVIGFDTGIIDYDPRQALQTVSSPGLLIFGENDLLVPQIRTWRDLTRYSAPIHRSILGRL